MKLQLQDIKGVKVAVKKQVLEFVKYNIDTDNWKGSIEESVMVETLDALVEVLKKWEFK